MFHRFLNKGAFIDQSVELFWRVGQKVHGNGDVPSQVEFFQAVQEALFRRVNNDHVHVAHWVVIASCSGTEKNNRFRMKWLDSLDDLLQQSLHE